MTYKAEMKKFLETKKLPADKGTYPEELMTQITINAFEELLERIQDLDESLEASDNELYDCKNKVENLNDKLEDFQLTFKQIKELTDKGV